MASRWVNLSAPRYTGQLRKRNSVTLTSYRVSSLLVSECIVELRRPATVNGAKLVRTYGHAAVPRNKRVDYLARQGAKSSTIGPEPILGVSTSTRRTKALRGTAI
ncbi:hypothetical protein JTB14_023099 [Gonioctena quinquepunctata]|nr:hypothetical protein JTB14_023099 [Gonioctena quinquepunctata]